MACGHRTLPRLAIPAAVLAAQEGKAHNITPAYLSLCLTSVLGVAKSEAETAHLLLLLKESCNVSVEAKVNEVLLP